MTIPLQSKRVFFVILIESLTKILDLITADIIRVFTPDIVHSEHCLAIGSHS